LSRDTTLIGTVPHRHAAPRIGDCPAAAVPAVNGCDVLDAGTKPAAAVDLVRAHEPGFANVDLERLLVTDQPTLAFTDPDDLERVVQVRRVRMLVAVRMDDFEAGNPRRAPDPEFDLLHAAARLYFECRGAAT
jgi:hypothetical protein